MDCGRSFVESPERFAVNAHVDEFDLVHIVFHEDDVLCFVGFTRAVFVRTRDIVHMRNGGVVHQIGIKITCVIVFVGVHVADHGDRFALIGDGFMEAAVLAVVLHLIPIVFLVTYV